MKKYFSKFNFKKIILYLFLFLLAFFISFFVTYVCMPMTCDDVWLFGFTSNIMKGLIIYRDYNVVTTPLYYFIGVMFLKAFGDYIISMGVFNSLLNALIFLMMFRVIKWKSLIVFPVILIFFPNGYNLFSLFWLMLILFLIATKKDNDYLIAFIIGLLFITKQNIGVVVLLPYLYYSKHKLKGVICFLIPLVLVSIYLLLNNAFYEFIDYCFLGLFDFSGNNYHDVFLYIELLIVFYLIIKLVKSKFRDKELFYILVFQIIMYPLADCYHFFVAFFPVSYYVVKRIERNFVLIILASFIWFFNGALFLTVDVNIHIEDDVLFLKNSGDLSSLMEYFNKYLSDDEYYYFTGYYGYLYKLYYNIPISKYDLWNAGNHGYKGYEKRLKEVDENCDINKCLFFVDREIKFNNKEQSRRLYEFVVNKYVKVDSIYNFDVYSS